MAVVEEGHFRIRGKIHGKWVDETALGDSTSPLDNANCADARCLHRSGAPTHLRQEAHRSSRWLPMACARSGPPGLPGSQCEPTTARCSVTGPPAAASASTVPAQIRAQQIAALKFCSEYVDVRDENGRRTGVISQEQARRFLAIGGYEAKGQGTVKYLLRSPVVVGPVDGPKRNVPPRASDNFTITKRGNEHEHRFAGHNHPWPASAT